MTVELPALAKECLKIAWEKRSCVYDTTSCFSHWNEHISRHILHECVKDLGPKGRIVVLGGRVDEGNAPWFANNAKVQ
jgi:hypothetical protein